MGSYLGTYEGDALHGSTGADSLMGSIGNDVYFVDNSGDVIKEGLLVPDGFGGTTTIDAGDNDDVFSSVSYTLPTLVESLTLTGTATTGIGNELDNVINGNATANKLSGNAGNDSLYGWEGNDTLEGGDGSDILNGGSGSNTLIGGKGDDVYLIQDLGQLVTEVRSEGEDRVLTAVNYTLTDNVERLELLGSAALNGTGNAAKNTLFGNAGANVLDGKAGVDVMLGGAGNDVYIVDTSGDVVVELAGGGSDIVEATSSYTLTANIENLLLDSDASLRGTGNALNNTITGGAGKNTLSGDAGNDTLYGGAGNDTLDGGLDTDLMVGGVGSDTYVVNSISDVVSEIAAIEGDIDTVQTSIAYTLGANIEKLTLTGVSDINGTGNSLNNVIQGNAGDNALDGGSGDDTLTGGYGDDTLTGSSGKNTLDGGAGNDTYNVSSLTDSIKDSAGTDKVFSSVGFTLASTVEDLTLIGSALSGTGNKQNNIITGNASNNSLFGSGGNDQLIGGDGNDSLDGGVGNDTMDGGIGNDIYVVDSARDFVLEKSLTDVDTVQAKISYTLTENIEKLTLVDDGAAIYGGGNTEDNVITGNSFNNIIYGASGDDTLLGGAGNDTLNGGVGHNQIDGGDGSDTFIVGSEFDVVIDAGKSTTEIDTVISQVDYSLGNNIENLKLDGAVTYGNGNALNNVITGNSVNNLLFGNAGNDVLLGSAGGDELYGGDGVDVLNGGVGADYMSGGNGNDTYYIDSASDLISESNSAATDIDMALSSISYTLGTNVERLTLTDTSSINGTGNALANILTGNSGVNTLSGLSGNDALYGGAGNDVLVGGVGSDTLTGGDGADKFDFNFLNELGLGSTKDIITDFKTASADKIDFSGIDTNSTLDGDQGFTFVTAFSTTNATNQIRFSNGLIQISTDADVTAEYEIGLSGVSSLLVADLIL